jgi:hypothetical protein
MWNHCVRDTLVTILIALWLAAAQASGTPSAGRVQTAAALVATLTALSSTLLVTDKRYAARPCLITFPMKGGQACKCVRRTVYDEEGPVAGVSVPGAGLPRDLWVL